MIEQRLVRQLPVLEVLCSPSKDCPRIQLTAMAQLHLNPERVVQNGDECCFLCCEQILWRSQVLYSFLFRSRSTTRTFEDPSTVVFSLKKQRLLRAVPDAGQLPARPGAEPRDRARPEQVRSAWRPAGRDCRADAPGKHFVLQLPMHTGFASLEVIIESIVHSLL